MYNISIKILTFLSITIAQAQSYNQNLVAFYPFNNNVVDISKFGGTAIPYNLAYTSDRNGKPQASAYFNGYDARLEILDAPQLSLFKNFTISFWIKPDDNNRGNLFSRTNFGTARNTYYAMAYALDLNLNTKSDSGVSFWINDTKQCVYNDSFTRFSSKENKENIWTQVTGVMKDGIAKLFINGVLVQSRYLKTDSITKCGASNFIFGANWANDLRYFKGAIDDIKIFNIGLNEKEVERLYSESDLIAYYPLIENENDITEYSNNGIPTSLSYQYDDCLKKDVAYFNGTSSKLTVFDAPQNNLTKQFTISMMVKPLTGYKMNLYSRTLYRSADNAYYGLSHALHPTNFLLDGVGFRYFHNDDASSCRYTNNWSQIASQKNLVNVWSNVTVVYGSGKAFLYVNGVLEDEIKLKSDQIITCGMSDFIFGANWSGGPRYFYGYMSDIKIFQRSLNSSEVSSLYKNCDVITSKHEETKADIDEIPSIYLTYENKNYVINNSSNLPINCNIYSIHGKKIDNFENAKSTNNLYLSTGMYVIHVIQNGKNKSFKVIVNQ